MQTGQGNPEDPAKLVGGGQTTQKRGRSETQPGNEARRFCSEKPACPRKSIGGEARSYAAAKPSEVAKSAGMPKSMIATCPEVSVRALRASRLAHERRECARCVRMRIASVMGGDAAEGSRRTSRRWCRTSWIHARRCCRRLQSFQSRGSGPTPNGCNSTLTWRGFEVLLPSHWHCSRRAQGRQLRMLAPYTMRRLPSASLRCSCGVSFCSAGHRSVPSGRRAKSWPETATGLPC